MPTISLADLGQLPERQAPNTRRTPHAQPEWSEVWLSPAEAGAAPSAADALAEGHSVLIVPGVASPAECAAIARAGVEAQAQRVLSGPTGELPTAAVASYDSDAAKRLRVDLLGSDAAHLCRTVLRRVLSLLDSRLAALRTLLFKGAGPSLAALCDEGRLTYTPGEPAVNVYTEGGEFVPHRDNQAVRGCGSNGTPSSQSAVL